MTTLLILVEGQSEEQFVKFALAPYLATYNVYATPTIITSKTVKSGPNHKGGFTSWGKVRNDLSDLLNSKNAYVSTLVDFYGLPADFPNRDTVMQAPNAQQQVVLAQRAMKQALSNERFIPFVALHEFEAWVFSAPEVVGEYYASNHISLAMNEMVRQAGNPEAINNGIDTHPKKRLQSLRNGYSEINDTVPLLKKIGIDTIAAQCPHFSSWLQQLCQLPQNT